MTTPCQSAWPGGHGSRAPVLSSRQSATTTVCLPAADQLEGRRRRYLPGAVGAGWAILAPPDIRVMCAERPLVTRRILALIALSVPLAGGALTTVTASADPVTVTNDGGCRHAYLSSGKEITPSNGVCYLGPTPIEFP